MFHFLKERKLTYYRISGWNAMSFALLRITNSILECTPKMLENIIFQVRNYAISLEFHSLEFNFLLALHLKKNSKSFPNQDFTSFLIHNCYIISSTHFMTIFLSSIVNFKADRYARITPAKFSKFCFSRLNLLVFDHNLSGVQRNWDGREGSNKWALRLESSMAPSILHLSHPLLLCLPLPLHILVVLQSKLLEQMLTSSSSGHTKPLLNFDFPPPNALLHKLPSSKLLLFPPSPGRLMRKLPV